MRVCNPTPFQAAGGGFYFMQALEEYLEAQGHVVTRDIQERYDILLVNSWHVDHDDILEAIRCNPRVRIVHRVDGSSQDYGRDPKGDRRQRHTNRLADVTIFQSEYCRYSTREKFPVILHDGPVIHNAVNTDLFSPDGESAELPGEHIRLCYVTFSTNPMKGWGDVYALAEQYPDLSFMLVGRYDTPPSLPNLHILGQIQHEELPTILRSCDAFLAFHRNEACPNVVLEAMACGLPVLYVESGAIPELVGECGLSVTTETFRAKLNLLLAERGKYVFCTRQAALERFHPEKVFSKYIQVMQDTLARPFRERELLRWVRAWAVEIGRLT